MVQDMNFTQRGSRSVQIENDKVSRGLVFDIQRFSLHDGPGLRTNVFFKGCPLNCFWCCNPESQRSHPEIAVFSGNCTGCGDCIDACSEGAFGLVGDIIAIDRDICTRCGSCESICPSSALQFIGYETTAEEVMSELLRDTPFYTNNGGMTLSGGEPTLQSEFARDLLRLAKSEMLHTTLETCGHTSWGIIESLLPYLDLILYDIKHIDSTKHRQGTGVGNEKILANLEALTDQNVQVIVRVPLIPDFNTDEAYLKNLVSHLKDNGLSIVHVLPYHALGRSKYSALGMVSKIENKPPMSPDETDKVVNLLQSCDLNVNVGG